MCIRDRVKGSYILLEEIAEKISADYVEDFTEEEEELIKQDINRLIEEEEFATASLEERIEIEFN